MDSLALRAETHLRAILQEAIRVAPTEQVLVIFDTQAPLARILVEAYRAALPTNATFVDFDTVTPDAVRAMIDACRPSDVVILVQSTNFRLDEFRLRIELFKRDLKTIEHLHLLRMSEDQFATYIESLAYDSSYYRGLGAAIKTRLDTAQRVVVSCAGTELIYEGGLEEAKLNVGDYSQMKNVGGTFPIGEVFTEARDLATTHGEAMIFGFAGDDHCVRFFQPFKVTVNNGVLTPGDDAPEDFKKIIARIQEDEEVLVRELGLGLNPAFGREHLVNDITAFERQRGVHLSLGEKHGIYPKPGLNRKQGRYHVDVFVDVEHVTVDGDVVFANGKYTLPY